MGYMGEWELVPQLFEIILTAYAQMGQMVPLYHHLLSIAIL